MGKRDWIKNTCKVDTLTECCAQKEIWSRMCDWVKIVNEILTSVGKRRYQQYFLKI